MRRRPTQRGISILEILIVLAIVGLMMRFGLPAVRSFIKTDLRTDANQVAGMLRAGYELATLSGIHHRVVLDLDESSYELQACPEDVRLAKGDEEALVDKSVLETIPKTPTSGAGGAAGGPGALGEIGEQAPEQAVATAAALAGISIGGARCVQATAPNGDALDRANKRTVRIDRGIKIARVDVQHLDEPVEKGKVAINFFPLGWSEKAVVQLTGDDDSFTVVVHALTGRVEISGDPVDVDKHMRRDAAGDEVVER